MGEAENFSELPDDIEELKQVILSQRDEIANWKTAHKEVSVQYERTTEEYQVTQQEYQVTLKKYRELEEKFRILQNALYGRSSEKWSADEHLQASLFNEAEIAADEEDPLEKARTETTTFTVSRKTRGKRKPIPDWVPRKEIVHDIPEEEKICGCGMALVRIGEEVSEQIDYIPARMEAIRHIRPKYACPACEGSGDEEKPAVRIAPVPKVLLPKSIATAGLVSQIVTSKYCDALPLYRQEKIYHRLGLEISRGSMSRWIIALGSRISPLLELMDDRIRSGPLIQMDETRVQVHGEPGRENHTQSFMWVARGGPPEKPLVRYMYYPSRGGAVPRSYLEPYSGYLQTDGYDAYTKIGEREGIVHVGCLAHARRKFDEAMKGSGGSPAAREFISLIAKIYRVEKELRGKDLSDDQFVATRIQQVSPLLEKLENKLEKKAAQVPPSTALGRAVTYTLQVLPKIKRYVDLAVLTPDNNAAERSIRPFVLGRKNWLFCDTPRGAHASAAFYSLIESAKEAELEPYWYIRYVLEKLPEVEGTGNWEFLLPGNCTYESLHS